MSVATITRPLRVDTSNPPLAQEQVLEAWRALYRPGRMVGEGSYRKCVLSVCGNWVFKFMYDDGWDSSHMNRQEYDMYLHFRDSMPPNVLLPVMHFIPGGEREFDVDGDIIVAEYMRGFRVADYGVPSSWHEAQSELRSLGIADVSGDNLLMSSDKETFALVDLGGYATNDDWYY